MKDLTCREIEILRMLWDGASTKDIACTLELSTKTVETHRAHIYRKSGIPGANLMLVVRWGLAQGYLQLQDKRFYTNLISASPRESGA